METPMAQLLATVKEQLREYKMGSDAYNALRKVEVRIAVKMIKEKVLIKKVYSKGDSNGCGCHDYRTPKEVEEWFNETFNQIKEDSNG